MDDNLEDGEFWLPPQFLTDDDTAMNSNNNLKVKNDDVFHSSLKDLFPSRLSSPVESLVGSSETESSDEEELMTELTRRMTHQLDLNCSKGMAMSGGSPPKSPNSVCQMNSQSAAWNLLHAAAGEVEKMRLMVLPPVTQTKHGVGFYTQNSLSHQQLQIAQFQMLREQPMVKQQEGMVWGYQQQRHSNTQMGGGNGARNSDVTSGGGRKIGADMGLSPSAWPHVQQAKQQHQFVGGLSDVFSGKRVSTGTGVFLPRRVADCSAESRKKPACPTVLVSTKVVQQAKDLKQQRKPGFNENLNMDYASAFPSIQSNYGISQQQKRNVRPQPPVNHEIRLPQEWTY